MVGCIVLPTVAQNCFFFIKISDVRKMNKKNQKLTGKRPNENCFYFSENLYFAATTVNGIWSHYTVHSACNLMILVFFLIHKIFFYRKLQKSSIFFVPFATTTAGVYHCLLFYDNVDKISLFLKETSAFFFCLEKLFKPAKNILLLLKSKRNTLGLF